MATRFQTICENRGKLAGNVQHHPIFVVFHVEGAIIGPTQASCGKVIARTAPLADSPRETHENDTELVVRCQRHDPEAFRALVERYRRRACKVACNVVGNMEVARDISQEAFVRVFRGIAACDPDRGFKRWFDRIVVNLSIDYLRKHRRTQLVPLEMVAEPSSRAEGPGDASMRDETRHRVHEVLRVLPLKHRTVLVMRDIEGMDCGRIAVVLGKSPGTVRWRLSQARRAFRRVWERAEQPPD